MILTEVEVYNHTQNIWSTFEGIVDLGASYCGIAEHIANRLGLKKDGIIHLWQVEGRLYLRKLN